jgi:hypothetical protein
MPLVNISVYKDPRTEDVSPENVRAVLSDIEQRLVGIGADLSANGSFQEVLGVVNSGKYEYEEGGFTKEIDLSSAKRMLEKYRRESGQGCFSCLSLRADYDDGVGETNHYCGKFETPRVAYEGGKSPLLKNYKEKGCEHQVPRLPPLEEVLTD